jgi:hypothetical protein
MRWSTCVLAKRAIASFWCPSPQKSGAVRSRTHIAGYKALKQTPRVRLRTRFKTNESKQTVFKLLFSKSSGISRRSRRVPLPEPELIANLIRIQRNRIGAAKICDQCRLVEFPAIAPFLEPLGMTSYELLNLGLGEGETTDFHAATTEHFLKGSIPDHFIDLHRSFLGRSRGCIAIPMFEIAINISENVRSLGKRFPAIGGIEHCGSPAEINLRPSFI